MAPWTAEEDALLARGVDMHGDDWVEVATHVPGRDNKACRKRWLHAKSVSVKKGSWSTDEDALLIKLFHTHGPKWAEIARGIPGRTDDACAKRYREALDPSLKKIPWSSVEDETLMALVAADGKKWAEIGRTLDRGPLDCRNRFRFLDRRVQRQVISGGTTPASYESAGSSPTSLSPVDDFDAFSLPVPNDSHQFPLSNESPMFMPSPMGDLDTLPLPTQREQQHIPPFINVDFSAAFEASMANTVFPSPMEGFPTLSLPEDSLGTNWLSPGSFSQFLANDPSPSQEYTPPPYTTDKHIPPFNYSSSSLSTALSAPLLFRPLPSDSPETRTSPPNQHVYPHSQPQSYASSPAMIDSYFDHGSQSMLQASNVNPNPSQQTIPMAFPATSRLAIPEATGYQAMSPISPTLELPEPLGFGEMWRSPHFSILFSSTGEQYSPSVLQTSMSSTSELSEALSSVTSPPLTTGSFSPSNSVSSSSPGTPLDIPATPLQQDTHPSESNDDRSLLLSVTAPSTLQAKARSNNRAANRHKPEAMGGISSALPAPSDAYSCGFPSCWSRKEARFYTSGELEHHIKKSHKGEKIPEPLLPYRCSLNNCEKMYRTMRGLQYHLQISPEHYKELIHNLFCETAHEVASPVQSIVEAIPEPEDEDDDRGAARPFKCPHPNCFKAYKQGSGLHYHLHKSTEHKRDNIPSQLQVLPPALEGQLKNRTKRLRPKDTNPSMGVLVT